MKTYEWLFKLAEIIETIPYNANQVLALRSKVALNDRQAVDIYTTYVACLAKAHIALVPSHKRNESDTEKRQLTAKLRSMSGKLLRECAEACADLDQALDNW